MYIDVIDTFDALKCARDAWDAVYAADPEANVFLTYQWIDEWLDFNRGPWFVLAAKRTKESADYVAFLPLRIRAKYDKDAGLYNQVYFAGAQFSDYAGVLCRPEVEDDALRAFASHIKRKLSWAEFSLDRLMMSERRRRILLGSFDKAKFRYKPLTYIDAYDATIDHAVSPRADLPDTWDGYLAKLSSNNRQKIRRLLKKAESSERYRMSLLEGEEQIACIDILLEQWRAKWAPLKGEKIAGEIIARNREMLRRSSRNGSLLVSVFRDGERQVAALATLIDPVKRSLHFFITGRDESFADFPAGYLLHAFSIRHAIAQGFTTYDFLIGNEPYKYHFATRELRLRPGTLRTNDGRNPGGVLDPRCLAEMVRIATEFDDEGKYADAEVAYRQITETVPEHALMLYRLGRLLAKRNDYWAAVSYLKRSVAAEPAGDNAWRLLARSFQTLGETGPALDAWGKLITLQPDDDEAKKAIAELRVSTLLPSSTPIALHPHLQGLDLSPPDLPAALINPRTPFAGLQQSNW